jgi:hypothetical protein
MLPQPVVLAITIVSLVVVSIITLLISGVSGFLVVLLLAVVVYLLLRQFGILKVNVTSGGLDISFMEKVPVPSSELTPVLAPLEEKEVFHIGGNQYTYNEAAAVCAAYGAELASYDQINDAFGKGAEWCEYGWSVGGMALYPTQESTWQALQQEVDESKRTSCGRPGVNGGYFDPRMKYGVNCYGKKPGNTKHIKLPIPPGGDNKGFNDMVNKFKNMIHSMSVLSFNRSEWSEYAGVEHAKKSAKSMVTNLEKDLKKF